MSIHIDILIDGSGSMGNMKGTKDENKYLIDAKHNRTDLVKKILNEHLVAKLDFCDYFSVDSFCNKRKTDPNGKAVIKDKRYVEHPNLISHYNGIFKEDEIIHSISNIQNPEPGGTPLRWALLNRVHNASERHHHIIVFSDGDGYLDLDLDKDWHTVVENKIKELRKAVRIHIIGIAQNEVAQQKSKYLSHATQGVYTNLKSMNYDVNSLHGLLFNLKTGITSTAMKTNLQKQLAKEKITKSTEVKQAAAKEKIETPNVSEEIDFKDQVVRNTKSLNLISSQLDNIVNLLKSKRPEENEKELVIFENETNNKRIGRLAEEFLYRELLKNNWEKVDWLNEYQEQYLPYDFIITDKGKTFYYECKGTSSDLNEFQLTKDEWEYYLQNRGSYRVYFVSNVDTLPTYVRFEDLLEDMSDSRIIPCPSENRMIKGNRIIFQVL